MSSASSIPWTELTSLPELNPPTVMPQGNVGTPLSTFMALIRACKLPSHVIRKLRLEFPKSRSSKRYGAVSFEYGSKGKCSKRREGVVGSGGEEEKGGQSLEKVYASDNVKEEEEEKEEQGVCGVKVEQNKGEDTDGDISNDDADANDKEEDIPSVSRIQNGSFLCYFMKEWFWEPAACCNGGAVYKAIDGFGMSSHVRAVIAKNNVSHLSLHNQQQ